MANIPHSRRYRTTGRTNTGRDASAARPVPQWQQANGRPDHFANQANPDYGPSGRSDSGINPVWWLGIAALLGFIYTFPWISLFTFGALGILLMKK